MATTRKKSVAKTKVAKAPQKKAVKPKSAKPKTREPKAAAVRTPKKKPAPKAVPPKKKAAPETGLDLSALPGEAVIRAEKWICLACVLDVFTRLMGLAPKTAHQEIKSYTPPAAELWAPAMTRPYFARTETKQVCPYCGSAAKWHAQVPVYRIESGKATDTARRALVKNLPKDGGEFAVVEEKATQQHAFFEWLDKVGAGLNLDDPRWLRDVSLRYLGRKEPKVDWEAAFTGVHGIRRSRRLESGWEVEGGRLYLEPMLFDELLLVQYLVSRSHKAGGLTLEGRYTLPELWVRLRNSGYLRAMEVAAGNAGDALEQLVERLGGGEAAIRFYHIVDRRDFLTKLKALRLEKVPRPKKVRA